MASVLPHVTAGLNAISLVLLIAGWWLALTGQKAVHRRVMTWALAVGAAFLAAYVTYHVSAPIFVFRGQGWVRPAYYALLISHVLLAAAVTPMVVVAFGFAFTGRFDRHRRLARWTMPIWVFVSASGILVYLLLYHVYT